MTINLLFFFISTSVAACNWKLNFMKIAKFLLLQIWLISVVSYCYKMYKIKYIYHKFLTFNVSSQSSSVVQHIDGGYTVQNTEQYFCETEEIAEAAIVLNNCEKCSLFSSTSTNILGMITSTLSCRFGLKLLLW